MAKKSKTRSESLKKAYVEGRHERPNLSGKNNSFYGCRHTEGTKEKNRQAHIGKIPWNKGRIGVYSEEAIEKMSRAGEGREGYWSGKKLSEKHKEKLSISHLGYRHPEEIKKKISKMNSGKNGNNWRGGKSFEPYGIEFNNGLKKEIRERDNHQCQFCGISENGRKHDIHHINYIKKDCKKRNLIALCLLHNRSANYNRDKWQFLFETLQEIRRI